MAESAEAGAAAGTRRARAQPTPLDGAGERRSPAAPVSTDRAGVTCASPFAHATAAVRAAAAAATPTCSRWSQLRQRRVCCWLRLAQRRGCSPVSLQPSLTRPCRPSTSQLHTSNLYSRSSRHGTWSSESRAGRTGAPSSWLRRRAMHSTRLRFAARCAAVAWIEAEREGVVWCLQRLNLR